MAQSLASMRHLGGIGSIALAEKDYDKALAELAQANQQNAQDLY